jgi:pimeloyl-ACP methyl ester carboxylesterase
MQPNPPQAWFREAGTGPAVVCLHSNASSSGQWRGLMDLLAPRHHVLAPDLYGAGRSPEWPSRERIALADEAALIEPALAAAGDGFALVGHSYGGAVALKVALRMPRRVRVLALYEPTLFALVDAAAPPPNGADGIRHTVLRAGAMLDAGDGEGAARCFIDFWSGVGAWDAIPPDRRPGMRDAVANIRRWGHALFTEPATADQFARLDIPVLLMRGTRTQASATAVADILERVLPRVRVLRLEGLGHMGPVTHAQVVNEAVAGFLEEWPRW